MTLHPPLEVSSRESNGIHFVEVSGRLTIGDPSDHLSTFVQDLVAKGARKVIVNLNEIPQIDSSGISALVKLSISLARHGGGLHLVCGQGRVRDALTVTRLVEAIPTFESESAARAGF
jgi:anti-sigma B factor antagonist